ncbi:Alpha/Beta hydrolase protein [Lineolata rhizophorae]|uniref:Alpha/Beta hydrolase protein n=1 Tax=Lineolata rhizophorae TaxID=578093 RepID=A0A6A6NQV7_9PEZI|nr:Alpha/Beta hydrolase protein [Lineolata rhizophorae]
MNQPPSDWPLEVPHPQSLPPLPLAQAIRSYYLPCPSVGLTYHVLESVPAGTPSQPSQPTDSLPLILLLHGFPELAFSWRKVMPSLATRTGSRVVAVDQRGYGRTAGWDARPHDRVDMRQFGLTSLVRDVVVLAHALGCDAAAGVRCVVGHDFGAVVAALCSLMRPDLFRRVATMSHPLGRPGALPETGSAARGDIHAALAALPRPRKHYKWYNASARAASDWAQPVQGMPAFLRGYLHVKSGDWAGVVANRPRPLPGGWAAGALAAMPDFYIMPADASMPEAVARMMAAEPEGARERTRAWMSDGELGVYVDEWHRTGFQGALNWYRTVTERGRSADLALFAGKKVEVPATFVSGELDWGNFQEPGVLEGLDEVFSDFKGVKMIEGAGHWVQQEKPDEVVDALVQFIEQT